MRALLAGFLIIGAGIGYAHSDPTQQHRKIIRGQVSEAPTSQPAKNGAPEQRGTQEAPVFVVSIPASESESSAWREQYEKVEKPNLDRRLTRATEALANAANLSLS
jgi:hypothetical protein